MMSNSFGRDSTGTFEAIVERIGVDGAFRSSNEHISCIYWSKFRYKPESDFAIALQANASNILAIISLSSD